MQQHAGAGLSATARSSLRWMAIALAVGIGIAGYYGPWVPHRAAGLVIIGLDLAEYVKFLSAGGAQQAIVRRELFYLPLFAASLCATFMSSRAVWPCGIRLALAAAAIPMALAMLPPAWSPATFSQHEFRLQILAIGLCLGLVVALPLLQRLADSLVLAMIALPCLAAAVAPAWEFLRVLPAIESLYRQPLIPGWGLWACNIGFGGAAVIALLGLPGVGKSDRPRFA